MFQDSRRAEAAPRADAPLAARMRPRSLDEFVGQADLVGPGAPLRVLIERDEVPSIILWGPPGSGKTTLASIIAERTDRHFERIAFNACPDGRRRVFVADLSELVRGTAADGSGRARA